MRTLSIPIPPVGLVCAFSLIIMLGCSSGESSPTAPNPALTNDVNADVSTSREASTQLALGAYEVTWSTDSGGVGVRPLRSAERMLGLPAMPVGSDSRLAKPAVEIVDASRFLDEGIVEVDVSIAHPFESRAMTVFDVMGIVIGTGSIVSDHDPSVRYAGEEDLRVANADGYTRVAGPQQNGSIDDGFTATINGYKYFAAGIERTETLGDYLSGPSGSMYRGAFLPGSTITRRYVLDFPVERRSREVDFKFVVLANWRRALDSEGRSIPEPSIEDFPLGANSPTALNAGIDTSESTAWYVSDIERGGEIVLHLMVWDWQMPLTQGDINGQISEIFVESPSGMLSGGPVVFGPDDIRAAEQRCCIGEYSTRLRFVFDDVLPGGLDEELLIGVVSTPVSSRTNSRSMGDSSWVRPTAYFRVPVGVHNEYRESLRESIYLTAILRDTPESVYNDVRRLANGQFAEMDGIGDQIREIYRANRGSELGWSVQSQVAPLVDRLSRLREDRADYVASQLRGALGSMQDRAASEIEQIPDTTVVHRDVVLNSLGVSTTLEHVAEIEGLGCVCEVITGIEAIPVLDTSTQSLKLRPGTYPEVLWDQGYHGEGFDVLLIDLGMLASHPAFTGLEIISEKFPTNAPGCNAEGGFTHGTWCAGAMASQDTTYTGTAYGLETFYNGKLCNGYDAFQTMQQAYDWAGLGGAGYDDAEIVSMSLVMATSCSQDNGLNAVSAFVDNTVDLYGAMWSLGAGNHGVGCSGEYIRDKPQTCYNGVSVAAINVNNNTGTRDDDTYWSGSKYGPCHGPYSTEERLKPEVLAPTNVNAPNGGGGWSNFPGTSGAAPHYAGVVIDLYSAGVPGSLEMRALTFATAEDYTSSPGSIGPDFYTGFGYIDAWEAYSHIADTFSGTLENAGEGDFYTIQGVQEGDRVVLVYNKHGVYPNWQISNLDILVYDESTKELLHQTTKEYENKEWIQFDSTDAGKDVIIVVIATEFHSGVSSEDYAISANTVLSEYTIDKPELTVSIDPIPAAHEFQVIEVSANVENTGAETAEDVEAEIDIPSGWQLVSGDNPQPLGDLNPTDEAVATWEVFAASDGEKSIDVTATGGFLGTVVTGNDSATVSVEETVILNDPGTFGLKDVFDVHPVYTNYSPGTYESLSFEINFFEGNLTLVKGDNPAAIGDIDPGNDAEYEWSFLAEETGSHNMSVTVEFTYSGQLIEFDSDVVAVDVDPVQFLTVPDTVTEGDEFVVEADYTNNSDRTYGELSITVNYSSSMLSLASGDNPASVGDIPSGDTAHAEWEFEALQPGEAGISLTIEFTYDGEPVSFTTPTQNVVIEEKYVDPFAPILLAPADGTDYRLRTSLMFRWQPAVGTSPIAYWLDVWVDGRHSSLVPVGGVNLGKLTQLNLAPSFVELYAEDGEWEWAVAAQISSGKRWSERWVINKRTAPELYQPATGATVRVNGFFDWETIAGANNYVARVTGILPGGRPFYLPLNSSVSTFQLTRPYYDALEPGVTYTWAVAATALGPVLSADDQDTLARLSYSEIRSFSIQ